ncbi:MAG TPA: molybdopterin-dependent oxidoreductase, partial [Spirochaetota bacterium]|nr:molybdopterin-dependent oxidoreductase [Spirochaetota bacterium]
DENGQGNPYAFYTYSVQGAKVRVNLYTGKISVEKVIAAFDAGTVINPTLFEGQIEGAIAMGLGYALSEEIKLSKGIVKNNNFDEYIIPMSMDMPETETITIQSFDPEGPFGAKGVGEPAVISTAPAIANAVSIATNKEFFNLPLSLEEVSNVLKEREATT